MPTADAHAPAGNLSTKNVSSSTQSLSVAKLPDLTHRIEELGLAEEYQRQRHGYIKWRQWNHTQPEERHLLDVEGAKGEFKVESLLKKEEREHDFKGWYKDFHAFQWQKTFSYWVGVNFMIGSALFTATGFAPCISKYREPPFVSIFTWLAWVGNLYYSGGMYLMLVAVVNFNIINFNAAISEMYWNPFAYLSIRARMQKDGVNLNSYHIALCYCIGVVCYNVLTLLPLLPCGLPELVDFISGSIGGFTFWLAGVLEMWENSVFPFSCCGHEQRNVSFEAQVASLLNMIGGLCFLLPSILNNTSYYTNADEKQWWDGIISGVGALSYLGGAMVSVLMWQNNQLGLSFMSELNRGQDVDDEGQESGGRNRIRNLSWASVLLVWWSSFFCAVAFIDFVMKCAVFRFHVAYHPLLQFEKFTQLFSDFLPFVLFNMLVSLISAVPRLPEEQPYRTLLLGARILSILIGVAQAMQICMTVAHLTKEQAT